MIQAYTHNEYIATLNVYKLIKYQSFKKHKAKPDKNARRIDKSTATGKDFNIPLSVVDRTSRKPIRI